MLDFHSPILSTEQAFRYAEKWVRVGNASGHRVVAFVAGSCLFVLAIQVLGFDTDPEVIQSLAQGESYLEHLHEADALFRHLAESPKFTATVMLGP